MKSIYYILFALLGPLWTCCAGAAPLPVDWRLAREFQVPAPGLVKLSLPIDTLGQARPALEDLRLYDDEGRELPYALERPGPAGKVIQNVQSFRVALNPSTTTITLETGLAQPLDAITLDSPAASFIKPVRVEASADGQRWQTLAQGQVIFRQSGGASQLQVAFPAGVWPWLRLTVDDQRSAPIPFSGARVHAAAVEPAPSEPLPVKLAERYENPGESRLTLDLGAANLTLANIEIETPEPLFTRQVALAVSRISDDSIHEETLAQGTLYRIALEGQPASTNLAVPLETQVRSRELLLLIKNQDSPALPVTAVRAERRPVFLAFYAPRAGRHHLLLGNPRCAAPKYDLAALGENLKRVPVSAIQFSSLAENPSYRPPEVLPGVRDQGTALDISPWKFRKAVRMTRAGVQNVELDLDVLARAQPGWQDLRLLREGNQWPYLLERTSISRPLTPAVTATNDPKNPQLSRWILQLTHPALPVTRLTCRARTPLFQRDLVLREEVTDERGDKYRRDLGRASWVRTPGQTGKELMLTLESAPRQSTLFLETDNGDNPPIELEGFQLFYPATHLLFKAKPEDPLFLYYGNPRAVSPRYDLSLAAGEMLAADKATASLGEEIPLRKSAWGEGRAPGQGGLVFWSILALVVVVLLVLISRLLPKPPETS